MEIVMRKIHRDFATQLFLQEFHQGNVMQGYRLEIPMKIDTPHEKCRAAFLRE
jgi:hypothetical protein